MPDVTNSVELLDNWLVLSLISGVGPVRMKEYARVGWSSTAADAALERVNHAEVQQAMGELPRLQAWAAKAGNHIIPAFAPTYPPLLLTINDPPPVLYVQGAVAALSAPAIAIVGTRKPSSDGRRLARDFGGSLARAGYVVISGLALGIDTESHGGALSGDGLTVAVLGSGLDQIYPKANLPLAERIREQGALISEFPPWTSPAEWHFPVRNRVISGLSHGVLVVEAAQRSGSLITARLAAEQGREVFAVPGSIFNPQSRGCHTLLRAGAKLVEEIADILEELPALMAWEQARHVNHAIAPEAEAAPLGARDKSLAAADLAVLNAMGYGDISPDQVAAVVKAPVQEVVTRLCELELRGLIEGTPAGFRRTS